MSYSLTATGPKADIVNITHEGIAAYDPPGSAKAEANEHLAAIDSAVSTLVDVVGTEEDTLVVSISGHANVGHEPADGWADEFTQVTVVVRRP